VPDAAGVHKTHFTVANSRRFDGRSVVFNRLRV
jgi:hypothetical protein